MRHLGRLAPRVIVVGLLIVASAIGLARAHSYESADFFCLWTGARVVLHGGSPYDQTTWAEATGGQYLQGGTVGPSACTSRFAYPLWTAIALAPVGALPLDQAAVVWIALAIGGTLAGTVGAWRAFGGAAAEAPLLAALVFASQPFWLVLNGGQIAGILLGAAGLACVALTAGRLRLGGVLLGTLILKPQLVTLLLPAMGLAAPRAGRWRLISGIGGMVAALLAVSLASDPGWLRSWLAEVSERAVGIAPRLASLWGLADDLFGSWLWAIPLIAGCGVGSFLLVRRHLVGPATWLALFIPWSVAAAPHAWSYDHLLLVVPWAATLAYGSRAHGRQRWVNLLALACAASLLPWVLFVVAHARGRETISALTPVVALFLLAFAIRTTPRSFLDPGGPVGSTDGNTVHWTARRAGRA